MKYIDNINSTLLLKLFAVIFWYLSISFIIQLIAVKMGSSWVQSTLRHGDYRWDYEAMYAVVNVVWGVFCWKASAQPEKHSLFVSFTIWANIFHPIVMTTVGIFRPGDFFHLLGDSLVLFLPAVMLLYLTKRHKMPSKHI